MKNIESINVDYNDLYSDKRKKPRRIVKASSTTSSTKERMAITNAVFPIVVDLKCEFLNALPGKTSIRERRDIIHFLDKAAAVVLNKDPMIYSCEE